MGKSGSPAYVEIAKRLRGTIVAGRLAPDRRLPSEAEMAERHGVSRSTIREALRQLSSQGLVVTTRGVRGGSRVGAPDHSDVGRMLDAGIALLSHANAVTVPELVEARGFLEVPAARLAAARRSDADIAAMRAGVDALRSKANIRRVFEANRAFHAAILEASGNRVLSLVTEPLFAVLQTRFRRDLVKPGYWAHVQSAHRRILGAIERGDGDAAARAMSSHLARLRELYEAIDSAQPRAPHGDATRPAALRRRARAAEAARRPRALHRQATR